MKTQKTEILKKIFSEGVVPISDEIVNFDIHNLSTYEEPDVEERNVGNLVLKNLHWYNDINYGEDFYGFKPCLAYPFESPPIIHLSVAEIDVVLSPKTLYDVLVRFARANNSMHCHAMNLGLNYDVFVVYDYFEGQFVPFFNTLITSVDETNVKGKEYCLAYPGMVVEIERPKNVEVAYLDINGEIHRERWGEYTARWILQNYFKSRGISFWQNSKEEDLEKSLNERQINLMKEGVDWDKEDLK